MKLSSPLLIATVLSIFKGIHAADVDTAKEAQDTPLKSHRKLVDLKKRDCSKPSAKNSAWCFCRYHSNWETKKCQNKFWNTKYVQDNLDKVGRIVGGEDAPINKYPWFARGTWIGCGGMLVTPEFVLTAAHCTEAGNPLSGGWKIGAYKSPYVPGNNGGQLMVERDIAALFEHPEYNSGNVDKDFALTKLASSVTNISPINMDQNQYSPNYGSDKRNLWAIGLGTLSSGGFSPNRLKHVELGYITQTQCNSDYNGGITDSMMCAADPGQDSCQGDSGGPLWDQENNAVVGVVSWGYGCADPNYPGVYSRIAEQWDWIKTTICDNSDTKPSFCGGVPDTPAPTQPTPNTPAPTQPTPNTPAPTQPTPNTPAPTQPTPTPCSGSDVSTTVTIKTDAYPDETSWSIVNAINGQTVASVNPGDLSQEDTIYTQPLCLPTSTTCYTFAIVDAWGDGITDPGYYELDVGGTVYSDSDFTNLKTHDFGNCNSPCGVGEKLWELDIETDNYGSELKWLLKKKNNAGKFKITVDKRKFGSYESNGSYTEKLCIPEDACYKTMLIDKFGDGMCCSQGEGGYKVSYDGAKVKESKFEDVKREITKKFGGGC